MKNCLDYEYKWEMFEYYSGLRDFLNEREIPKENIVKIEKTYRNNIHLLYTEPKDYSKFY